jgi:hypothetical protein
MSSTQSIRKPIASTIKPSFSVRAFSSPGFAGPGFSFKEARRIQQSFLSAPEKKALVWMASRTPSWINSDHLTAIGLIAMAGAGAGYWWSNTNRAGLLLVIFCLAVNWLGDSLDGTLARYRNQCRQATAFILTILWTLSAPSFCSEGWRSPDIWRLKSPWACWSPTCCCQLRFIWLRTPSAISRFHISRWAQLNSGFCSALEIWCSTCGSHQSIFWDGVTGSSAWEEPLGYRE